jgi:threonine aldolase
MTTMEQHDRSAPLSSLPARRIWRGFASDNYAGTHPDILTALAAVNEGHEIAYGEDSVSVHLRALAKDHFGPDAEIFPVFNGTGANVIALQACARRWEAVICSDSAHVHVDEGGAPEVMAGLKLWTIPTEDGKLTPELISSQVFDMGVPHRAQPAVVTIANTTEMGTVYRIEEIRAIADYVHTHGLLLHMDGARLSNAAAALSTIYGRPVSFAEFTTDAGVDIVSFGGTKIGAMGAEAVIVLSDEARAITIPFLRKTSMQLASKMRFIAAQLVALLENDAALALGNAHHANAMAARLDGHVRALAKEFPGVSVPNATEANAVFPILPAAVTEELQKTYRFYAWNQATGLIRWMCSWDTQEADVDGIISALRNALKALA